MITKKHQKIGERAYAIGITTALIGVVPMIVFGNYILIASGCVICGVTFVIFINAYVWGKLEE